jgi:hypothetical protein
MSSKHGRNAGKKSRDGQGKKKRDRHDRRRGLVSFETLETRDLLSATLFDEGVDRFVMSTDVKASIGTIGTPDRPVVTYTGGLASYTSGLTTGYSRDLDQIPFTLATTGNASSKIRVQFTPIDFDGSSPVIATVVSNANGTSTATLSNMFQVGNTTNSSGIRSSDGTTVVTATSSFPDSKTIEWSLNGLAAGNYQLALKTADRLSFLPVGIGRSVSYTYEAVFQSFAAPGGTPDVAKPLGAQSPEPDLTSSQGRIGIAQYAAGRIDGSSAPGNFTNDPAETVGYWPAEGLTIVNLVADAGTSRIGNPNINLIDANGYIQFAGPTTTTANRFTWVLPNTTGSSSHYLKFFSPDDQAGTNYQVFVENYGRVFTADFTEDVTETANSTTTIPSALGVSKNTVNVSGVLRSYNQPGTSLGTASDVDNIAFVLPSRGNADSKVVIKLPYTGTPVNTVISATITLPNGNTKNGVFDPVDNALRFDLAGEDPGSYRVTLSTPVGKGGTAYFATLSHSLPTVSFGPVNLVTLTEGFGYGSTIAGLGAAIDTSVAGNLFGNWNNSLGLKESNKFTIENWYYPKPGIQDGVIWNIGEAYRLLRVGDTGLRLLVTRSGPVVPGSSFDMTVPNALNKDAWNHVAATFDGKRMSLYVNGVNVAQTTDIVPDFKEVQFINPNAVFFQSAAQVNVPQVGTGMVDELRVWNLARTQAELQDNSLKPLAGNEAGLVGYWSFDNPSSGVELDSSGRGNTIFVPAGNRKELPAPMLGSVDVAVDRVVEDPLGLWVTYNITGGTATPNVDFVSSAFRRTSTDPLSEKYGTIIPANEQTGKIYFYVKPDAIVEPAESATITLTSNSFLGVVGGQDYKVGTSNVATVNITDNDAYRQGVQVTDLAGRPITADSPLYISPTTGQADIKVRLTSQPNYPTVNPQQVVISLGGYPSVSYNYANGLYSSQNLVFTPANWDVPQTVTLVRPNAPTGTFTISGYSFPGTSYLPTTISFPYTQTPPNRVDTTEGSELDASAVPPTVSLLTVRGGREGSDQPALVQVNLNNAAPKGGLDVSYTIVAPTAGSATGNVDFRLPSGVVRVAEGEKFATIPIDVLDDYLIEGNESLIVRLVAQPKYVVGTPSDATLVITDDDRATISVSNPSFVDVNSAKSIVRPGFTYQEPGSIYAYGESLRQSLGQVGTATIPTVIYRGGISANIDGRFNRDTIEFNLPQVADPTAKISVQFTPTSANGEPIVTTLASGADGYSSINLADLFETTSTTSTRLTGGLIGTPRLPTIVGNDRLEWSLSGLAAGQYLLQLKATSDLRNKLRVADGVTGVSYDYEVTISTSPTVPYQVTTTSTVTNFSPTYSPLITNETVPSPTLALEPNNSQSMAYNMGLALEGTSIPNQMIDNASDVDVYRFTLSTKDGRPDTIAILFDQATDDQRYNLRASLENTTGALFATSDRTSGNEFIDLTSVPDGDYFLTVRGVSSAVITTPYTIKFKKLANPLEPTVSGPVYLGVANNGDRYMDFAITAAKSADFLQFTLDSTVNRPDSVSLVHLPTEGNLRIGVYNVKTGAQVGLLSTRDAVKTVSLAGLADGDYEVRISPTEIGSLNKYDLVFGAVGKRAADMSIDQVAIRLNAQPTANVVLNLTNSAPTEGRLSVSSLTFTPSNWNQYQLVQVTPLDDGVADGDKTYTITATASSPDDLNFQGRTLSFNVVNVDRGNFVQPAVVNANKDPNLPEVTIASLRTAPIAEGATFDAFRLTLSRVLSAPLTVTLDYRRGTAEYSSDFTISTNTVDPNTVIFPAGSTSLIIRATLINDGVDESATDTPEILRAAIVDKPGYRLTTTVNPGYLADIPIADANVAGLTVLAANGVSTSFTTETTENASTPAVERQVRLNTKPLSNVTVFIASSDPNEALIQTDLTKPGTVEGRLVFTPDNWNVPQKFFIKGVDDRIDDGRSSAPSFDKVPYRIVLSSQSEDDPYQSLAPRSFDATNLDDDQLGITTTSPQSTVNGRTNVFSVVLNTQPVGEVRVTMTPDNDQVQINGARAGAPATLVFNGRNWNVPQLVTVIAVDDGVVEYIHESRIRFKAETGRRFDNPTTSDIGTPQRAYDLGDVSDGVRWTNLKLPPVGESDPSTTGDQWYRFSLAEIGTSLQRIRLYPAGDNRTDVPTLGLYSSDGTQLLRSGSLGGGALADLGLENLPVGSYLIRLSDNGGVSTATLFDLRIDGVDRDFESLVVSPIPVSIIDNDLPTAEILAGSTASEVFSQPSYFAVRLNAPASAELGDSGVKVNFKISGGRASQGTASSSLHDYTVLADSFDPVTGVGWVRVAPGDVQANIGIVPIDDKAVEDLPLTVSDFGFNPVNGYQVRLSSIPEITDPTYPYDPQYLLPAGTLVKVQISPSQEVEVKVRVNTPLVLGLYGPSNALRYEYAAAVPIDATAATLGTLTNTPGTFKGRIESEEVEVTLLGGIGYTLPLAPDKQGADSAVATNLDSNRVTARMTIYDDDVAGVQVINLGDHTSVAEGEETEFRVLLTGEPRSNVTVTLTPGVGLDFVSPSSTISAPVNVINYNFSSSALPSSLDLNFVSLHETDLGMTAVFTARLASVSQGSAAKSSSLTLRDSNGSASAAAQYQIPGIDDVDFAGAALEGTWNSYQRIVVSNLTPSLDGTFRFVVDLDGVVGSVTLTPVKSTVQRPAIALTFTPTNWFVPQLVTLKGLDNSLAEPGSYHKDFISYATASADPLWDKLVLPFQEVRLIDSKLDVGDTIDGLDEGLDMLQDGLLGLKLPLLGSIGDLPGIGSPATTSNTTTARTLSAATPAGLGFFEDFRRPLKKTLASQTDLTVGKIKTLLESAFAPLVSSKVFDRVIVTPTANDDDMNVVINLDKLIRIGQLNLSADLGLDALGLKFQTTGSARADLAFSMDVGFGWNKKFGFYFDTEQTGIQAGVRLYLTGTGITADNPANLFTGLGAIGGLQLDFTDDPLNPTSLSATFQVSMNDLDNINSVRFFDVNKDGLLADQSFTYNVGVDANKDGRIDKDANGNPVTRFFDALREPWANVTKDGSVEAFPTVPSLRNNPDISTAVRANWNTVGAKTNTFDEATNIKKEGIYRLKTQGNKTIAYLDVDRDGKLDIGKRNVDPFATPWNSLNDANRRASEIWFVPADPKNVKELKVLVKGTGNDTKYYLDLNQDGKTDPFELITKDLYKRLDKDGSKTIEGDIIADGEGKYVQGTALHYFDANKNGKLDTDEAFVTLGFEPFQLPISSFSATPEGKRFLDFNGDGGFNFQRQLTTAQEFELKIDPANNNFYVDIDADSIRDPNEPQAGRTKDTLFVQQSAVDPLAMTVNFDGNTYNVLTIDGKRFIDLDENGVLTLDRRGRPLEPFAVQSNKISATERNKMVLRIDSEDSTVFSSLASEVTKLRLNQTLTPAENQRIVSKYNDLVRSGQIVEQFNDGDRLTLSELKTFLASTKGQNTTKSDQIKGIASQLFTYSFLGDVNIGLKTKTSISGSKVLPAVKFDLDVNYPLFNIGNAKDADSTGLTLNFRNVAIDMGTFLGNYVEPILKTADNIIKPIKPIIKALNADTKVFGKLGLASTFESDGKPGISLLEIAKKLSGAFPEQQQKIDKAIKFAEQLTKLANAIDKLTGALSEEKNILSFGDFSLDDFRGASDDVANSSGKSKNAPRIDNLPQTTARLPNTNANAVAAQAQKSGGFKDRFNALRDLDGFEIKLFDPSTVLGLITGESNVDLVKYDVPDIDFSFMIDRSFPIWGPIAGKLEGGFKVKSDLAFGFDTRGIEEWAAANYAPEKSYLVFDGLYLADWTPSGAEKDELTVQAYVGAGLGLDLVIASGFIKGGIEGLVGFDVVDTGERAGTSDGKVRGSDIITKLSTNPADLFNLHGTVNLYLGAEISVDFGFFSATVYENRLATVQLVKFTIDSSGLSGSSIGGRIETGPLAGATVWFDANNNLKLDDGEPFAITNYEGDYELVIPDDFDQSTGTIRVQGGIDISTGVAQSVDISIPTGSRGDATAFTALEEALDVLPIDTSHADLDGDFAVTDADGVYFVSRRKTDPNDPQLDVNRDGVVTDADEVELNLLIKVAKHGGTLTTDQSSDLIKEAFGIDPSVDFGAFKHFEEALAGNPLAGPVMLGENSVNTLVQQMGAVLSGIGDVLPSDPPYTDIFSESIYLALAHRLLEGGLDLTDASQVRSILLDAAYRADQLVANFNDRLNFDRLTLILDDVVQVITSSMINQRALAEEADGPVAIARLITEAKVIQNGRIVAGLYQVALGNASGADLVANEGRTDAAYLDQIKAVALPPLIGNVNDVFLFEDESVDGIPISVRSQVGDNAGLEVEVSSSNPSLLPPESLIVTATEIPGEFRLRIAPVAHANGSARITITVTDRNDGKVSEERFTVTVAPVNDEPVVNDDFARAVAGEGVQLRPSLNDRDVDQDRLFVGLLTAPEHGNIFYDGANLLRYVPDPDFVGTEIIEYEVVDGNGGSAVGFMHIQVFAPATSFADQLTVTEGGLAENAGTFPNVSDIPVELDASVGVVILTSDHEWAWSWTPDDGPSDSQTVTITANYGGLLRTVATFQLNVTNAAPSITSLITNSTADRPVQVGDSFILSGVFIDPSMSDTHSAIIDWGDGETSPADIDPATRTLLGQHQYARAGVYNVVVTLTDDDTGTTQSRAIATVDSIPAIQLSSLSDLARSESAEFQLQLESETGLLPRVRLVLLDWGTGEKSLHVFAAGQENITIRHEFTSVGSYRVEASLLNDVGQPIAHADTKVNIVPFVTRLSPTQSGKIDLVWGGTAGADEYLLREVDTAGVRRIDVTTVLENGVASASMTSFVGITGDIIVFGGRGDDVIDASNVHSFATHLDGGEGDDVLTGSSSKDLIAGDGAEGQGNDRLEGGDGDDVIYADASDRPRFSTTVGNDTILGGDGNDIIEADGAEGARADTIDAGDGDDIVLADGVVSPGNDSMAGSDLVWGGEGRDIIVAGPGADTVSGGLESDLILAASLSSVAVFKLPAIQAEWESHRPLSDRVANLQGTGTGERANGEIFLLPSDLVNDDDAVDQVFGNEGDDWLVVDEMVDEYPDFDPLLDLRTNLDGP